MGLADGKFGRNFGRIKGFFHDLLFFVLGGGGGGGGEVLSMLCFVILL